MSPCWPKNPTAIGPLCAGWFERAKSSREGFCAALLPDGKPAEGLFPVMTRCIYPTLRNVTQ